MSATSRHAAQALQRLHLTNPDDANTIQTYITELRQEAGKYRQARRSLRDASQATATAAESSVLSLSEAGFGSSCGLVADYPGSGYANVQVKACSGVACLSSNPTITEESSHERAR